MSSKRSYHELIQINDFYERIEYLKTRSNIGFMTFNGHRYLNQTLYRSNQWRQVRRAVILRDHGCDLAFPDMEICGTIIIHHINPICEEDIIYNKACIYDMENLISTSLHTHNIIHYEKEEIRKPIDRRSNDICPWR